MTKTLYTIGYSGFRIDDFINILKKYGVNAVIDVRSNPFSSYFLDYNKGSLERSLGLQHIYYRSYAKEFGAQQSEQRFYTSQGYLDFEAFTSSEIYNHGYSKIENGMKNDYTFVFMCSEKDPLDCHRTIMISKTFNDNGYSILHLLPDEKPISQLQVEEQLLDRYFPDRNQMSFLMDIKSNEELIPEAYRKRNADIGYHLLEA